MEYEIDQVDSDDYCTISADGDFFVQFCNPPLPTFVPDNFTMGKSSITVYIQELLSKTWRGCKVYRQT